MDGIESVIESPAHDEAQRILAGMEPAAPPSSIPVNTEPVKRKGGWPAGKPRGPRKPKADGGTAYAPPPAPIEPEQEAPAAPRALNMPDPKAVEFVTPWMHMGIMILAGLAARITKRADLIPSKDELETLVDASANAYVYYCPGLVAASPGLTLLLAAGAYAGPRIDPSLFGEPVETGDPQLQGAPVAIVPAST